MRWKLTCGITLASTSAETFCTSPAWIDLSALAASSTSDDTCLTSWSGACCANAVALATSSVAAEIHLTNCWLSICDSFLGRASQLGAGTLTGVRGICAAARYDLNGDGCLPVGRRIV